MLNNIFSLSPSKRISALVELSQSVKQKGYGKLSKFILLYIRRRYSVYIDVGAQFAGPVSFPHPVGIVIGRGVVISENVTIYQNVTIGGARAGDWVNNYYPKIEQGVTIYAGAVLIGNITVGADSIIGANAVVNRDVYKNSTVVGIPAREI
ncbi:serine O-acetyltransferase [Shewanella chilikensis]|uniref:serine O-acetyltransferase n=1 Tax=Shewanella chilikensis TaxID=558541 RepID=UPI001CD3C298|nr:serine acetyltransferase [Shewanella chilikensis]MCA0950241.1 serine acetyltransferase [Shewanella chilikensis]